MNEETADLKENVNWPKRIVVFLLVAILIAGGAVAAYIALNSSPKNKYFHAEGNSLEFMKDVFKERYEPELTWSEDTKEKAVKSTFTVAANYEDNSNDFDMFNPAAFINHSSITIVTERDVKAKKLAATLNANLGTIEVGDFSFYVTEDKLMLALPFLQEILQVNEGDIGNLLHNLDDEVDPNASVDLSVLFDGPNKLITDEQKAHIEKEYIEMIYEELPDEAFTSSKEKVEVNNESVNAEKIAFHLSEDKVKDLLKLILDKMSTDEALKEIVHDMIVQQVDLGMSFTSVSPEMKAEIDELMDEYEEALQKAKSEIDLLVIKDGIHSTLWIDNGLIVKRDFKLEIGESEDDLVTLQVKGTQLLQKNEQFFDYNIIAADSYDEGTVNINASFKNDSGKSTDSITLAFGEGVASYNSEETLKDNKRDFERSITFEDQYDEPFKFVWSGNASYDRDKMNSDHTFTVDFEVENEESFELQVAKSSELIKEVSIPDGSMKDLGGMDQSELVHFIEYDLSSQYEQWLFGILGGGFFDF